MKGKTKQMFDLNKRLINILRKKFIPRPNFREEKEGKACH